MFPSCRNCLLGISVTRRDRLLALASGSDSILISLTYKYLTAHFSDRAFRYGWITLLLGESLCSCPHADIMMSQASP